MEIIEQLSYVVKEVPYYNKLFNDNDRINIMDFPIVNKKIMKTYYADFISREYESIKRKIMRKIDLDCMDEETMQWSIEDVVIEKTSGSSGVPFYVPKTLNERILLGNSIWQMRRLMLPDINMSKFLPINHIGNKKLPFSPYDFEIENLISFYDYVKQSMCECMHIQSPILLIHIDKLKKAGVEISLPTLKYIESNGSFLSNDDKCIIQNYFGVKVINQYGTMETWPIGMSVEDNEFFINKNSIYLQIVDEKGQIIREANRYGKIVVTTKKIKLMPFVRYDTGDYGAYIDKDLGYFKLNGAREFSLIKGFKEPLFGNEVFSSILTNISQKGILLPEHTQIYQEKDEKFNIFFSPVNNEKMFLNAFLFETEKFLKKQIELYYSVVNETEVWEVKHSNSKHHMFINKIVPGWVEKANDNRLIKFERGE